MKEFKGTQGPWHVSDEGKLVIRNDKWYMPVASCGYRENNEESANARLIAAAPELLDVLQKLLASFSDHDLVGLQVGYKIHAEKVIAKALGE